MILDLSPYIGMNMYVVTYFVIGIVLCVAFIRRVWEQDDLISICLSPMILFIWPLVMIGYIVGLVVGIIYKTVVCSKKEEQPTLGDVSHKDGIPKSTKTSIYARQAALINIMIR